MRGGGGGLLGGGGAEIHPYSSRHKSYRSTRSRSKFLNSGKCQRQNTESKNYISFKSGLSLDNAAIENWLKATNPSLRDLVEG